MAPTPTPFTFRAPKSDVDDLRRRLGATRWVPSLGGGWAYGIDRAYLARLVDTWASDFDWRSVEDRVAGLPNYTVPLGGRQVHFVHLKSPRPDAIPLLMTHGWPSSFLEHLDIAPLLAAPPKAEPAFDVVVPSMPGYGFSEAPAADGRTRLPIAEMWVELMRDVLGYDRFIAHGGDIGAGVSTAIARLHPEVVLGLHLTSDWADERFADPTDPRDREVIRGFREWDRVEGAYGEIQGTKPGTLAVGLADSPAGLAAWIVEKWRGWSEHSEDEGPPFTDEQLLSTVTLYWLTRSIGTSFIPYFRSRHVPSVRRRRRRMDVPTGIARMPGDAPASPGRAWAARQFNLVHWTDMPRGGHFAAMDVPDLLAADLRAFAAELGRSGSDADRAA